MIEMSSRSFSVASRLSSEAVKRQVELKRAFDPRTLSWALRYQHYLKTRIANVERKIERRTDQLEELKQQLNSNLQSRLFFSQQRSLATCEPVLGLGKYLNQSEGSLIEAYLRWQDMTAVDRRPYYLTGKIRSIENPKRQNREKLIEDHHKEINEKILGLKT